MIESEQQSVVFPVVLYDGERQTDVGNIAVHPTLDFKQFQKMLKETVGISYNNLTSYLVDNNTLPGSRKILITGKVNFAVIVLEKNCYFLVVLKRSRRDRRRKPNKQIPFAPVVSPAYWFDLGRTRFDLIDGYSSYYEDGFHDLQMMKQGYLMYSPATVGFPAVAAVDGGRSRALCKDCATAEKLGSKAAFHLCVYDDVVAGGFRSPVGPISRPA